MQKQILVCDDEPGYLNAITEILEKGGFEVKPTASGSEALTFLEDHHPDLIILDRMLPDTDGLILCRQLKRQKDTHTIPIILLTARSGEAETIMGFECGADDYITKPFNPPILLARIKARLMTGPLESDSQTIISGNLKLDVEARECTIDDNPIVLRPKEFDLLLFFLQNEGKVLRRATIIAKVWNYDYFGSTRTIDTTIRHLRNQLGSSAHRIKTIPTLGYKFI